MPASSSSPRNLEESKERLRSAFTRLEDIVDQRLKEAGSENAGAAEEEAAARAEAEKKSAHVTEENEKLHVLLGKEKAKTGTLKEINSTVSQRLDTLTKTLQDVLEGQK